MRNIGSTDRILRLIAGVALVVVPIVLSSNVFANPWTFWGAILVGLVLIGTAVTAFCPIYATLRLSTRPRN